VSRSPSSVWRIRPELVQVLEERLGTPLDSYVNGTQTWLTDDGPGGATLEWRLHPVASYRAPDGLSHYDVWDQALASALAVDAVWDGLECFPAYGDEMEPATLAAAATARLGVVPDACGMVDHERIGDAWERSRGQTSIVAMLLDELAEEPS
jgi:hypothetical protein